MVMGFFWVPGKSSTTVNRIETIACESIFMIIYLFILYIPGLISAWVKQKSLPQLIRKIPFTHSKISNSIFSHPVTFNTASQSAFYRVNSLFLARGVGIGERGIYVPRRILSDICIPYAVITACSYFRNGIGGELNSDTCAIDYQDSHEKIKL